MLFFHTSTDVLSSRCKESALSHAVKPEILTGNDCALPAKDKPHKQIAKVTSFFIIIVLVANAKIKKFSTFHTRVPTNRLTD